MQLQYNLKMYKPQAVTSANFNLRWLKTVYSTYIGWVVITTFYHLMLQPWYQKTSQSLVNTLQSFF